MTIKTSTERERDQASDILKNGNVVMFPAVKPNALNWRELLSVKSMTAYVAHNQNVPESTVRAFIEAAFSVTDITTLKRDDYERVMEFLVDINVDLMTN